MRISGNSISSVIMVVVMMMLNISIVDDLHAICGSMAQDVNAPQLAASCNINMSSSSEDQRCANLGNISIPSPFVNIDELKAYCTPDSADFVLANCSSHGQQAFWETFTKALPEQDVQQGLIGPPAVIGLISAIPANPSIHLNLTWDSQLMRPQYYSVNSSNIPPPSACRRPRSSTNLSHYFPTFINLSLLHTANTMLTLSSNTIFLLFNCSTDITSINDKLLQVVRESSVCQMYAGTCNTNLTGMFGAIPNCHQLDWEDDTQIDWEGSLTQYLSLQSILDNMSCTHFEVFVVSSSGGSDQIARVGQWLPGVMQLRLINTECEYYCQVYGGKCVYDASNQYTYQGCNCTENGLYAFHAGYGCFQLDGCWKVGSISICNLILQIFLAYGGILLFLVALCCSAYRCGKRSMKNRRLKRRALWARQHSVGPNNDSKVSELVDLIGLSERPVEFSYKSVESATSSFSSLVGKGGFGVVFKGVLAASKNNMHNVQEQYSISTNSKEIAVKVLDVRSQHSKKQFLNEVAIIGRVHHMNVVRLLGFCLHDDHEILVYEYVTNGSLDKWLFEPTNKEDAIPMLDWRQRYSIAVGIARGLSYLHEECRHRIVHCDVKPQNILLDGQMCPKIADFGLARLINRGESRVMTFAKGTPGYMAPELWVGGDIELSTKADVYSFGMVLLELISGRKNFALGLPHYPAVAFDTAINKGDFDALLDGRLKRRLSADQQGHNSSEQRQQDIEQAARADLMQQQQQQQVRIAGLVALWCIQDNAASRPCMSAVVQFLEGVAAVSEHPPHPTIAASANSVIPTIDD